MAMVGDFPLYAIRTDTPVGQQPHCCPVCEGRQTMPVGFYPGEITSESVAQPCRTCKGEGILWR